MICIYLIGWICQKVEIGPVHIINSEIILLLNSSVLREAYSDILVEETVRGMNKFWEENDN
ncbi:hypothetical protein DHD08_02160 [Arenibacter sp. H213]|uniref:Uncharacterized protein n=1 Tax=Arenibacter antarcticus TaxID=2040469 RepID=A0ABW5VEG4_9FLAO|nr:hypothetical protein [Arenibacter sp. H213]MCM4166480.1 hypothetical protein [Arenibacter sp. H213]